MSPCCSKPGRFRAARHSWLTGVFSHDDISSKKYRVNSLAKVGRRLWGSVRLLISRYRITAAERSFFNYAREATKRVARGGPIVVVEAVEDHYYVALFGSIVAGLCVEQTIDTEQFLPRSLRPGGTRSVFHFLKGVVYYNALTDRKWERLYGAFCRRVAYKSASSLVSRNSFADLLHARRIWKKLESKESLVELTIAGIKVGDLIYDSYLRFKPAATVDLKSRYLWIVIWQAMRDIRAARAYMFTVRPKMFLTTYSTYIQHGIAARTALAAGVEVFTFGNYQEFYKKLSPTDWMHTRNPDSYRLDFAMLENPLPKLAEADRALSARLSGVNDAATAYMRRSAYGTTAELPEGLSGSLMLFLHDFFDSPHCYQWMIFPDFLEWATFTLDLAREAGIKVFVKPHPNQIASSKSVVKMLMAKYPDVIWLSTNTSNVHLAQAGIACAVTIHGTVAHEMAYLGIPTIAAGHNPHISFAISHTAHNRDEYRQMILKYKTLPHSAADLRRGTLQFYCMHNLTMTPDEVALQDVTRRFRALIADKGDWLYDGADFSSFVEEISTHAAFKRTCRELAAHLIADSGCKPSPNPVTQSHEKVGVL